MITMPYKESIFKKIESHKKAVNTTDLLVHVFPNFNLAIERHKFPSGFSHPPPPTKLQPGLFIILVYLSNIKHYTYVHHVKTFSRFR